MKHGSKLLGALALSCLLSGMSAPASAQKGGGGGGGGGSSRIGGTSNIVWDTPPLINGKLPRVVGQVNVSTYITTINLDVRLSSVNLPDNTLLTVTVYANDYFTGLPWLTKDAGTITIKGQTSSLTVAALWVTAPRFLPIVTRVVVTKADGTVVAGGKP